MNAKQSSKRVQKITEEYEIARNKHFPGTTNKDIWNPIEKEGGYSRCPRAMPILLNLMDELSAHTHGKGKPVSDTYFALWSMAWIQMTIKVTNLESLANEAGFRSSRAVTTLRQRMNILEEFGFIKTIDGANKTLWVLILHPYLVLRRLKRDGRVPESSKLIQTLYEDLLQRVEETEKWRDGKYIKDENDGSHQISEVQTPTLEQAKE